MTIVTVNPGELIPKQGEPPQEGRYVAFVRCESYQVKDWLEPEIVTWHGGRWHCAKPVFAWIGPLPLCKWADFKGSVTWDDVFSDMRKTPGGWASNPPPMEYDL